MARVFSPPTHDVLPPLLPTTQGVERQLWRHYKNRAVGRSVLKIAGVYSTIDTPSQDVIDTATEVYLGGHLYPVSDAVATALEAAGYTVGTV